MEFVPFAEKIRSLLDAARVASKSGSAPEAGGAVLKSNSRGWADDSLQLKSFGAAARWGKRMVRKKRKKSPFIAPSYITVPCSCGGSNPGCFKCGGWGYLDHIGNAVHGRSLPSLGKCPICSQACKKLEEHMQRVHGVG